MKRTHHYLGLTLVFALAAACGDSADNGNDAPPRLIEGGGAGDGAIDGLVNVHVIDGDTDEVLEGATVYIGEAGEELLEADTDIDGLAIFDDRSLLGPTTITVQVDDYEVATWMGINAANVTIPVDPLRASSDFGQGTITGTMDWTDLPAPEAGHFYIAVFSYSQTDDLGADENEIEQPTGDPVGPNVCFAAGAAPTLCEFSVESRTGTVAVLGSVIDIDTQGTEDDSDDTQTVLRLVYQTGLDVSDGRTTDADALTVVEADDLVQAQLDLPSVPSLLDTNGGILQLETADSGLITLGFTLDSNTAIAALDLVGDFADATYRVAAFSGEDGADEDSDNEPMSAVLQRGVTDLSDLQMGDYLPLATRLSESDDVYSFEPVDGAVFHAVTLVHSRADAFWNIAIFDGRTDVELPEIRNDPRPSSDIDMTVDAFDGAVDLTEFAIDDFIDTMDRFSKARTTL